MKKFLIVFLTVVLALSLCLVACKDDSDKGEDKVTFAVEPLTMKVGETPDFNGHVVVKVNGTEVKNPKITWQLNNGDPSVAGTCFYSITFEHNGKQYTTKTGRVTFTSDDVVMTGPAFDQLIGRDIVWKDHVTVRVNGSIVNNPTLTPVLKSGDPSVVNDAVYTVNYNYEGKDYTIDVTVRYTDVDPDDVDLLEDLFAQEYDSYTVEYRLIEEGFEDYPSIETTNVVWTSETNGLFQIHFVDDYFGDDYTRYISIAGDVLRSYEDYGEDSENWQFKNYSWAYDSDRYFSLEPLGYSPSFVLDAEGNLLVTIQHFTKVSHTKFEVKNAYLQDVAEVLFPNNFDEDNTVYTKIEVEHNGEDLTKITGYYTVIDEDYGSYDCSVSYTWSNLNSTTANLPDNATEYEYGFLTPDKAQDLTADQKAALAAVLEKTYESGINYEYMALNYIYLLDHYYCSGTYTADATYDFIATFDFDEDYEMVPSDTAEMLFTNNTMYTFYNGSGDYIAKPKTSTVADETYYIGIADLGITAEMFGIATDENGDTIYVVKPSERQELQYYVGSSAWPLAGGDYVILDTFTLKLDDEGENVIEWFLSGTVYYVDYDISYPVEMYCYYDFKNATISIPGVFDTSDIDATDEENVNKALSQENYGIVTVDEHGNEYKMYIVGNQLRVDGMDYSTSDEGVPFSKIYIIGEDEEGEPTFCELVDGEEVACEWEDILYNVLYFNFEMLRGHLQYNAATDTYICHVADFAQGEDEPEFDNDQFAYYWTGFWDENQVIDDIELTIEGFETEDGETVYYVTFVRMYVHVELIDEDTSEPYTVYVTMSATLSDFGTTQFPAEETEQPEQTESNED